MPKAIRDMIDADLVCIGSGPAGQRAAVQAAKLGKRVVVIEKRRIIGVSVWIREPFPARPFGRPSWRLAGKPNNFVNVMGLPCLPDPGLISCFQE